MKNKITHDQYLKLLGLSAIAEDLDRDTALVHGSAANLLELDADDPHLDNFYGTHIYDALHGSRGMKEALRLMKIEIEPPQTKKTFEEGDVVRNRMGGPPMTVENVCAYDVETKSIGVLCVWFVDVASGPQRGVFDPTSLEHTLERSPDA